MLKKLRDKKTAKKIWIILCILILPAFVLWGSGSLLRSKQASGFVGKIFGKKISLLEFKEALEAVKNQAFIKFGDNFSQIQKYLNLEASAWERLILLAEAKKRKINVSDKEVIELIKNYPFFKNEKEQFDHRRYTEMLRYGFHTSARIFEEQTRVNLMLAKLYNEVTDKINLTEDEIKEEYAKANEEISIYYIASLYSDFTKEINPSEQELKDYFEQYAFQFKQPLSFNIEYITFDAEDKLKNILSALKRTKDLSKVAKDFGLAIKESGLFNQTDPIAGIGWSPEFFSLISKLKIGHFSQPLLVDKTYYILRLKERKESYIPEFEDIKNKVREMFIRDKAKKISKERIEDTYKILKELYQSNPNSLDFSGIAKKYGLKSDSTGLFKFGSYIDGIGTTNILWQEAKRLKEAEFSGIIEMPSGFYVIKVKTHLPLDDKKFSTEKPDFSQKILLEKKQENFIQFQEGLKAKSQLF